MQIKDCRAPQRAFSPEGFFPFHMWLIKKLINKGGSLGKKYWYFFWKTYPWEPHKLGFPDNAGQEKEEVKNELENQSGIKCIPLSINKDKFQNFLLNVGTAKNPHDRDHKKSLEYYLTLELMDFKKTDLYIDIGSLLSPFPLFVGSKVKKVYCQDISYRPGFYKDQIGCNAVHIPLSDESVDKMTLHCTFEHFEDNNDSLFITEALRLLKPGGKCLIVPLYLSNRFINLTDPSLFFVEPLTFDQGALVIRRFGFLNRFGRIYSPKEFVKRVADRVNSHQNARLRIFWIKKSSWLPITRFVHFGLMLEKS